MKKLKATLVSMTYDYEGGGFKLRVVSEHEEFAFFLTRLQARDIGHDAANSLAMALAAKGHELEAMYKKHEPEQEESTADPEPNPSPSFLDQINGMTEAEVNALRLKLFGPRSEPEQSLGDGFIDSLASAKDWKAGTAGITIMDSLQKAEYQKAAADKAANPPNPNYKPLPWPQIWQIPPDEPPIGIDPEFHRGGILWNEECAKRGYDAMQMDGMMFPPRWSEEDKAAFQKYARGRAKQLRAQGYHPHRMEPKPEGYTGPQVVDLRKSQEQGRVMQVPASQGSINPPGRFLSPEEAQRLLDGVSRGEVKGQRF